MANLVLTSKDIKKIEKNAHTKLFYAKSMNAPIDWTTIWFNSVVDFLQARGDEILPNKVREAEGAVFKKGLSKEYFYALLGIVDPPKQLEEHEKFMCLMSASPDQRLKAVLAIVSKQLGPGALEGSNVAK